VTREQKNEQQQQQKNEQYVEWQTATAKNKHHS
jgi:hypothetical protein